MCIRLGKHVNKTFYQRVPMLRFTGQPFSQEIQRVTTCAYKRYIHIIYYILFLWLLVVICFFSAQYVNLVGAPGEDTCNGYVNDNISPRNRFLVRIEMVTYWVTRRLLVGDSWLLVVLNYTIANYTKDG